MFTVRIVTKYCGMEGIKILYAAVIGEMLTLHVSVSERPARASIACCLVHTQYLKEGRKEGWKGRVVGLRGQEIEFNIR